MDWMTGASRLSLGYCVCSCGSDPRGRPAPCPHTHTCLQHTTCTCTSVQNSLHTNTHSCTRSWDCHSNQDVLLQILFCVALLDSLHSCVYVCHLIKTFYFHHLMHLKVKQKKKENMELCPLLIDDHKMWVWHT